MKVYIKRILTVLIVLAFIVFVPYLVYVIVFPEPLLEGWGPLISWFIGLAMIVAGLGVIIVIRPLITSIIDYIKTGKL